VFFKCEWGIGNRVLTFLFPIHLTDIKQIYLIGGCDGAEANRTYFRDIAIGLPRDAVVLTLGCGKYRMCVSIRVSLEGV